MIGKVGLKLSDLRLIGIAILFPMLAKKIADRRSNPLMLFFDLLFLFHLSLSGYQHNPYNGVICNDTITATGVFASKELWRLAKGNRNRNSELFHVI